jgi:hypothetical protein
MRGSYAGNMCAGSGQLACENMPMQLRQFWKQLSAVSYVGKKLAEHGIMGAPAVQEVRGSLFL